MFLEFANLQMMCIERLGCLQQAPFALVRRRFAFAVDEPVLDELDLERAQSVVIEDLLHLSQRPRLADRVEIGVPKTQAAESGLGRRLRSRLEIEWADLAVAGSGRRTTSTNSSVCRPCRYARTPGS